MTIATTHNRKDYVGTGSLSQYSFDFPIFVSSDLVVYQDSVLLTLTTDYTVTLDGAAPNTGHINLVAGNLGAAITLALIRNVVATQGVDLVANDSFPAETIEAELDRLTMLSQQNKEAIARCLKFDPSSTESEAILANLAGHSGEFLRVNSTEDGIESASIVSAGSLGIPVSVADGGTNRADGAHELAEMTAPAGVAGKTILYDDGTSKRLTMKNNSGSATSVLGASDMTVTYKKGSGAGIYTSNSTSFTNVDGTNLIYTVTIPVGWKLIVAATGRGFVQSALVNIIFGINDSVAGIVDRFSNGLPGSLTSDISVALQAVIVGDGASHTITLQYATSNGADNVGLRNDNLGDTPKMVFTLIPSN